MWREWKKRAEVRNLTRFERFICERENLVFDFLIYLEPVDMGVGMVLKAGRLNALSMRRQRWRTQMPKASRSFPPSNEGVWRNFVEIYVRIGKFWSANHCWNLWDRSKLILPLLQRRCVWTWWLFISYFLVGGTQASTQFNFHKTRWKAFKQAINGLCS